ncbi:hypothetical protein [Microbulbifer epialgicus]|uniref:Uncharacterized protein n=1 Tax=Microbulbifer epialgicus TaxID=393907 RepID=A0ABV4P316_9GAMM
MGGMPVAMEVAWRQVQACALGPPLWTRGQDFSSGMAFKWTLEPYFVNGYLLGNDFAEYKFQCSVIQSVFKVEAMRVYVEVLNRGFLRGALIVAEPRVNQLVTLSPQK